MNPKFSIITPSLNQGHYIEQTIVSVLGNLCVDIEYLIYDGGSSDNTANIIRKYENNIQRWSSEKDNGQAAAINKGFNDSSGQILAWINADDMYLPGSFLHVKDNLDVSKPQLIFGNSIFFDDKEPIHYGSNVVDNHQKYNIEVVDYIIQPSCFFTRKVWELCGPLNENFHFGFDWDFFIRCKRKGVEFIPTDKYLSIYRKHEMQKSNNPALKTQRENELITILSLYNTPDMVNLVKILKGKTNHLRQLEYYLKKLRMMKIYRLLATLSYPGVFMKYPFNTIESVKKMF